MACLHHRFQAAPVNRRKRKHHMASTQWPTELRLRGDRRSLRVAFDTGEAFDLPAEYLRIASPSAEVRGHGPAERKTVPGKRDVEIARIEPVGNYAVKLI